MYQFSWSRHHVLSGSVGCQQPHQHDPNESKQTKANSVEPEAPDSARLSLEGDLSVSVTHDQPTVDPTQSKLQHNQSSRSFNYSSSSSHSSHSTPRASSSHQSWMGKKERFLTNPTVPTSTHRTAAIPSPTPRSSTSLYAQPSTGFPPSPTYHPPSAIVPLLNIGGNPPSFGFISVPSGYSAPDVGSPQYSTHSTPTTGLPYASPTPAGQHDGISVYYTSMNPPMSTSSPSQPSLHPSFHPIHQTGPGSNPMFPMYGLTASPHSVQSIPFYHQGAMGPPQVLYHQPLPSPAQSYPSVSVNNLALPPPATHSLSGMQRNFAQQPNSFQQQNPQQGQSSHAPQLPHSHQLSSHQPPLTQQHQHAHPHHNQQPSQLHQMLPSQPHPSPQQHQQQQLPHQPQHQHGLPPNVQHMPHQSSSMPTNHPMYPSSHHPSLHSSQQYPFSSMESPSNASGFYSGPHGQSLSSPSGNRHPQQLPPPPSPAQHPQPHSQSH